jgi:hypothetical protein
MQWQWPGNYVLMAILCTMYAGFCCVALCAEPGGAGVGASLDDPHVLGGFVKVPKDLEIQVLREFLYISTICWRWN